MGKIKKDVETRFINKIESTMGKIDQERQMEVAPRIPSKEELRVMKKFIMPFTIGIILIILLVFTAIVGFYCLLFYGMALLLSMVLGIQIFWIELMSIFSVFLVAIFLFYKFIKK